MFKAIYVWFVLFTSGIFKKFKKRPLPAPMEENDSNYLKLNLQFFAEDDEDDDEETDEDDELDEDDEEDAPDLDELLKDPKFKRQYNKRLKTQLGKRMKRYEGVDPEEYRRLKEKAGKKDEGSDDDDELETLRTKLSEKEKRIERAERREKRAMVKEFAVENQVNPKLLSRLINVDDIELDEDGEPDNLDELFEELEEEFPEYFGASDDDEDDEPVREKKSTFVPGSRQKSNKKKKVDPYEAGRLKALERHKKEDK